MVLPDIPDPQLFAELARRHGHYCPMSTLGLRLGRAGLGALALEPGDERLRVRYLARTCAVDGISLALQLPEGDPRLTVEDCGQHRLLVEVGGTGGLLELSLSAATLKRAAGYRSLPDEEARQQLLQQLRLQAAAELLEIRQLKGGD